MTAPQRILIIRLDRIGDVVLSTPVLPVLRQAFPDAHLAMLVRPVCRELLDGHPDLHEALAYDRDGIHHGWWATLEFAGALRSKHFDLALVLHPSNRSHVIPWAARIPRRIGYNQKTAWLLTQQIPHLKQLGTRHESDYTLDLVRALGVTVDRVPPPSIAQSREARIAVARWLAGRGIGPDEPLIAMHPSASDAAKRWPADRFARAADRLRDEAQARVVVISGQGETTEARAMLGQMRTDFIDASGQFSLSQLAALLGRCRLLVSNDSGPVHIAAAVGTPVVSLFGRNQPGLGPMRWGPVGLRHVALHRDKLADGGHPCTNAQCTNEFLDIRILEVSDVVTTALAVLQQGPLGEFSPSFPPR